MNPNVTTQVKQSTPVNANVNGAETLEQKIARLEMEASEREAKITRLESEKVSGVQFKCYGVGETYTDKKGITHTGKGVLSLYGLGQFPVSLYDSQWDVVEHVITSGKLTEARKQFAAKLAHKS